MTTASFTPHVAFGLDPKWVSVAVLALTYAFVIASRVDRAVVALVGASIVIPACLTKAKLPGASTGTRSAFSPA